MLLTLLLALIIAVPAFSIDTFILIVPDIARGLSVTTAQVQYSLTALLIGISLIQLFIGSLSDRFGRKPILYIGLGIYIAGSLLCLFTTTLSMLIAGRFLQGLAAGICVVSAISIARDRHAGHHLTKTLGYMYALLGLTPVIAPFIGSLVTLWLGWRAVFVISLFSILVIALITFFVLPETRQPTPKSHHLIKVYLSLLANSRLVTPLIILIAIFSCFFAYIYNAAFIYIQDLQLSLLLATALVSINGTALFLGSMISTYVAGKASATRFSHLGFLLLLGGGLTISCVHHLPGNSLILFSIAMYAVTLGAAILLPQQTSYTLDRFPTHAGAVAALIGCSRFLVASLIGQFILFLPFSNQLLLGIAIVMLATVAYSLFMIQAPPRRQI